MSFLIKRLALSVIFLSLFIAVASAEEITIGGKANKSNRTYDINLLQSMSRNQFRLIFLNAGYTNSKNDKSYRIGTTIKYPMSKYTVTGDILFDFTQSSLFKGNFSQFIIGIEMYSRSLAGYADFYFPIGNPVTLKESSSITSKISVPSKTLTVSKEKSIASSIAGFNIGIILKEFMHKKVSWNTSISSFYSRSFEGIYGINTSLCLKLNNSISVMGEVEYNTEVNLLLFIGISAKIILSKKEAANGANGRLKLKPPNIKQTKIVVEETTYKFNEDKTFINLESSKASASNIPPNAIFYKNEGNRVAIYTG